MTEPPIRRKPKPAKSASLPTLLRVLMVLVILAAGAALAFRLMKTGPKTQRQAPERRARLVEVQDVRFSNHRVRVSGMGTVRPAREIALFPQVTGEILWVSPSFIPGGRFQSREAILHIDPSDYELTVHQRAGDLQQAESNLKLELGQQSVALREFELLGQSVDVGDRDLVLRLPQLQSARAEVQKAKAALAQARRDLERTKVTAPFNAIVKTREVDLGESVGSATRLATLVGTDEYWIEVLIPVNQLDWITIPGLKGSTSGSAARITNEAVWGRKTYRSGTVLRLAGDLEAEGRMARLFVSVPDPLGQKPETGTVPLLLIGAFVRVEIAGQDLKHVAAIDRRLLRDGDAVWVMNAKNQLEIRPVRVAFRGRDQVYVSGGLRDRERLVVTDLAAPVEGMPLRTDNEPAGTEVDTASQSDISQPRPKQLEEKTN
ncbi:MAG: efflux RND transporter periplasmic adaptor subunit [Nitrospiria bacterium]